MGVERYLGVKESRRRGIGDLTLPRWLWLALPGSARCHSCPRPASTARHVRPGRDAPSSGPSPVPDQRKPAFRATIATFSRHKLSVCYPDTARRDGRAHASLSRRPRQADPHPFVLRRKRGWKTWSAVRSWEQITSVLQLRPYPCTSALTCVLDEQRRPLYPLKWGEVCAGLRSCSFTKGYAKRRCTSVTLDLRLHPTFLEVCATPVVSPIKTTT